MASIVAIAALVSLLSACASGPPEILGVEWTTTLRPGASGKTQMWGLDVFARVHDPDGTDDIESMWVVDEQAELSWSLDSSTWTLRRLGDDDWMGAVGLRMADGSPLPAGRYRVEVADLAGNRASYEFKLEAADRGLEAPSVSLSDGLVKIAGAWPENYLLAYDAGGNLLRSSQFRGKSSSLAALVGTADESRTFAVAVYGYDAAARRGAYSTRIRVR